MTDITIHLDYYEAVYLRDKLSKTSEIDELRARILETIKDAVELSLYELEAPIKSE